MRQLSPNDSGLPTISCEIGLAREKKTCANLYYREWTSGVSGLGDTNSQVDRLRRRIDHWRSLHAGGRDVVILGDSNLCAFKWQEEAYQYKTLASMIQDYLLERS